MMHEIIEKIKRHENFSFSYSGITIFMQWCPPGSFIMGSSPDEIGHKSDEFQHRVNFSKGFWISRSLVSQKLYDAVMDYNPAAARWQDPNLPVESVTWNNAFEFCKKIDLFFKKNIANDLSLNHTFIMPSEAEWEYACRASESSTWNIGENILIEKGVDEALDRCGWYMKNADGRPQAVEKKEPNAWGIYDMHGNVFEWCRDWYQKYSKYTDSTPGKSWNKFKIFAKKVVRGGAFYPVYSMREKVLKYLLLGMTVLINIIIALNTLPHLTALGRILENYISHNSLIESYFYALIKCGNLLCHGNQKLVSYISQMPECAQYASLLGGCCLFVILSVCIWILFLLIWRFLVSIELIEYKNKQIRGICQCRAAYRRKYPKYYSSKYIGFRFVLIPDVDIFKHSICVEGVNDSEPIEPKRCKMDFDNLPLQLQIISFIKKIFSSKFSS